MSSVSGTTSFLNEYTTTGVVQSRGTCDRGSVDAKLLFSESSASHGAPKN